MTPIPKPVLVHEPWSACDAFIHQLCTVVGTPLRVIVSVLHLIAWAVNNRYSSAS